MWWPAAAFVFVMVAPETATVSIAAAGGVLIALGALVPAVRQRVRRAAEAQRRMADGTDQPTVEIPQQVGRAA